MATYEIRWAGGIYFAEHLNDTDAIHDEAFPGEEPCYIFRCDGVRRIGIGGIGSDWEPFVTAHYKGKAFSKIWAL